MQFVAHRKIDGLQLPFIRSPDAANAAPISQTAMLIGLDSAAGSSVHELNFATTTRVGAAFTPRILSPLLDFGEPFHYKHISDCWPILGQRSSGNCTVKIYRALNLQATPTLITTLTFAMDGTSGPRLANVSGMILQFEVSFDTNDFYFHGLGLKVRVRN